MNPQYGLVGDSYGTDLPNSQTDPNALVEERRMAKFSRTTEFKKLKEHLENRIDFYQTFLPGNVPAENVPDDERGKYWAVSNLVVGELRGIIAAYETANQVVNEATKRA